MAGDLIAMIEAAQGGQAVQNLARQFGLSEEQVVQSLEVIVPELARGFERNMLTRRDLATFLEKLGSARYEPFAEEPLRVDPREEEAGIDVLSTILGSRTGSLQLAAYTQQETGIAASIIKKMLPYIASIVMSVLFKNGRGSLGDILERLPRGGGLPDLSNFPGAGGRESGDLGIPPLGGGRPVPREGQSKGGGGFLPPKGQSDPRSGLPLPTDRRADSNRSSPDGGEGWRLPPGLPGGRDVTAPAPAQLPNSAPPRSGFPLPGPDINNPLPGGPDGNPYGDLGDIVRRGGAGSGMLAQIIRSIFGSMLGRGGGSGMLGWLFKLLIARYGWRIVQAIFRGLLRR
jgi:hypothetical protein